MESADVTGLLSNNARSKVSLQRRHRLQNIAKVQSGLFVGKKSAFKLGTMKTVFAVAFFLFIRVGE